MALRSIDLTGTDTFGIDDDPDKGTDAATKFEFRRLTPALEGWVRDKATSFTEGVDGDAEGHFEPNKACLAMMLVALTGWANLLDAKGNPIAFSTKKMNIAGRNLEVPDQKAIDCLQLDWIRELHEKVSNVNQVEDEEVKRSGS